MLSESFFYLSSAPVSMVLFENDWDRETEWESERASASLLLRKRNSERSGEINMEESVYENERDRERESPWYREW